MLSGRAIDLSLVRALMAKTRSASHVLFSGLSLYLVQADGSDVNLVLERYLVLPLCWTRYVGFACPRREL